MAETGFEPKGLVQSPVAIAQLRCNPCEVLEAVNEKYLRISEIFESLQGEGPSSGAPATFLRLAGCNLRCRYCDTPFTWDPKRYDLHRESRSETIEHVLSLLSTPRFVRLVVTGGEPLLQQTNLGELFALLPENLPIEIETNGTIVPISSLSRRVRQWNVSPKLSSAELGESYQVNLDVLRSYRDADCAFLKLVLNAPEDLAEIDELIALLAWPSDRVVFMPEGTTTQSILERSPWVAQSAIARGHRFSTRLHVLLWGDERGR